MKRLNIMVIAASAILALSYTSCKRHDSQPNPPNGNDQIKSAQQDSANTTEGEDADDSIESEQASGKDAEPVPKVPKTPPSECRDTLFGEDKEGWSCLDGTYQCTLRDGCRYKGKKYLYGTTLIDSAPKCQNNEGIEWAAGYICSDGTMMCADKTCQCGKAKIDFGDDRKKSRFPGILQRESSPGSGSVNFHQIQAGWDEGP